MDDQTDMRRNRNGDAQARRTIPEFPDESSGLRPLLTLYRWAGILIVRWRRDQDRREGKTPDQVRLRGDALNKLSKDELAALSLLPVSPNYHHALTESAQYAWYVLTSLKPREESAWDDFLDWLGALDLADPADRQHASHAFDGYVSQVTGSDRNAGVLVTPEPAANLMLDLAAPVPGERVYDPCFGYGGLLVEAVRRMQAANGSAAAGLRVPLAAITGAEIDERAYLVGLCRVVLAGAACSRLACADALKKPAPGESEAGFDCILAAPPWNDVEGSYDRDEEGEGRFLRHVMGQLRPGGRAVVALPDMSLGDTDLSSLRKRIVDEYRVDGVVALPAGAFEPCTSIRMNLVLFSRAESRGSVRFVAVPPLAWESAATVSDNHPGQIGEGSDQRYSPAALLGRAVTGLIGGSEPPADGGESGVQAWDVPVRELALRSYELLVKPSDGALDAAIEQLLDAEPALEVKRLNDVADIVYGQSFVDDEDNVFESQPNREHGAILRATDVTGEEIRLPTLNLDDAQPFLIDHQDVFLRDADLLVPLVDTIGNIGLIESGGDWNLVIADGSIARVRLQDGIKPRFLAAMLRSSAYWYWFWSHAEGATIRRLSVDVLRTLRVPVPPVAVQDAVLQELSEPRDALAVLHRLLSGAKKNPVADWLETPLPARVAAAGAADGPDGGALSELAAGILTIPDTDYRSCGAWLSAARNAAATLESYDTVPSASGRLLILEYAVARFHDALGAIGRSEEELFERLRSFTRGMVGIAERKASELQRAAKLGVDVAPPEVEAGVTCEVRLRFTNGSVPLRDLRFTARQPDGTVTKDEAAYLAEGATHEMPVVVCARDSTESHRIDVAWQARRLDAAPIQGGEPVHVLVKASGQAVAAGDLGSNPYIVGNPIDRPDMFFGRGDIMDKIGRQLGGDHANVVLLEGNRRTGKTSILRQLGKTGALPGWIPVYCDFQELDSMATADVFRLLALRIGCALRDAGIETWIPDLERSDTGKPFPLAFGSALRRAFADGRPFETLEVYLEAAVQAAKPRRVLLMIDEFDKLQEGIDSGLTGPQVPENLRHLLQHQPGMGAIITGSRRLKRLREEYWSALFGLGYRIPVSELPKDHAQRLVTEPVAGRLRYLPQARDRLVDLCAGHPFLIQSLCSRVFDQAADGGERTITPDALDRAVIEMVRDNEHFRTLWDYARTERRRLILALCHCLEDRSDAVTIRFLLRTLEEHGVRARDQDMAEDIAELRELEFIHFDKSYRGGTYRLSVPLLARWMEMNVDFDELVVRAKREAEQQ